jgi:hypothetical protein
MQSFRFGVDIIPAWFYSADSKASIKYSPYNTVAIVPTAKGDEVAHAGDTIIKDEDGAFLVVRCGNAD